MFLSLYLKVLNLAKSKYAIYYLSIISFLESSILPYPQPDLLLAPMSLKQPEKAYKFAFICTVTSVFGGLLGYYFGDILSGFLIDFSLIEPQSMDYVKVLFDKYGILIVGVAAFSPIPYKLATISAGMLMMPILPFVIISIIARASRYYLLCFLVRKYGDKCDDWLRKYIDKIGYILIIVAILFVIKSLYVS